MVWRPFEGMGRRFESCRAKQEFFSVHWMALLSTISAKRFPPTLNPQLSNHRNLNVVHFARDHLSVPPHHDLRSGMPHVAYIHTAIQAVIESVWIFLVNTRECSRGGQLLVG
jgi:hypothetical protein